MAKVLIKRLPHAEGLDLPSYQTEDSAGADLRAAIDNDIVLIPGAKAMIPTGLSIALPKGTEGQVRPRSGLASKFGITVINAPGTVDADYRGEMKVSLINLGTEDFTVERGMRIAQLVVAPYIRADFEETADELPETVRGTGGFGSTGV
ncbi:dUTP diphosphatase [Parvularcula sp. ZS-1/3]|uniref:Deoxyuridine 5'-triphosphate nucleotidohydrolase n=1 Tax=Parvularcula mediterranea TaxID=2732508 RepID=A0A7Y3RKP3_9PROT|nr:dUTP diphosphatase [Parvularcula mediterranea]NNU15829.1 dUTP diphosphatase [Parvularcula mediterranea]